MPEWVFFTQKLEEFKSSLAPKAEAPKLADFESEEEWASAFFDYKNGVTPKQPKKETTPLGNVSQSQLEFGRKESLYADKHPEYYQNVNVLTPYLKQNPALKDAIFDTDPALADFLSNNLELVDQISTQTPVQIGRSLSIIENKFKRNQPIPKKAKKPAPATEQRGTTSSKDISKMTQSEYNEYMSKI